MGVRWALQIPMTPSITAILPTTQPYILIGRNHIQSTTYQQQSELNVLRSSVVAPCRGCSLFLSTVNLISHQQAHHLITIDFVVIICDNVIITYLITHHSNEKEY